METSSTRTAGAMCKRKDDAKGQPAAVAREWNQAGRLDAENEARVQNGTEIKP